MNPEQIPYWDQIPVDIIIMFSLFVGAVARLCDAKGRTAFDALKDLVLGLVIGAAMTGIAVKLSGWPLINHFPLAILSAYFSAHLMGMIELRINQFNAIPLVELTKDSWEYFWKWITDFLPKKKP